MFQFNQPCYRPSKLIFIKPSEVDMKLVQNTMQKEREAKIANNQQQNVNGSYPLFGQCFESPIKVKVVCTKREIHEYEHTYRYEEKEIVENNVIDLDKREPISCLCD